MDKVRSRCTRVAETDEPTIPKKVCELLDLEGEEDDDVGVYEGVDKAAAPAEQLRPEKELQMDMDRSRPLLLFFDNGIPTRMRRSSQAAPTHGAKSPT